jgi:hypothetical protein
MKYCQNMKRWQQAPIGSMGRKHDTARWHDDIDRRRGSTEEEKGRR